MPRAFAQPKDGQPAGWLPTVDKPSAAKPAAEKAPDAKPAAQKSSADKLATDKQGADKQAADKQAADKQGSEKQAADKRAAAKPAADKAPVEEKPAAETPPAAPAAAGEAPAADPVAQDQSLRADWVKAQIDEIGARRDLDEGARGQAIELYRGVLNQLEAARRFNATAAEYQDALQSAPQKTTELRQQLEALGHEAPAGDATAAADRGDTLSLADTEQRLDAIRAELASLAHDKSQLDASLAAIAGRPELARAEQANEKQGLDKLASAGSAGRTGEASLVSEARRVAVTAERLARSAKLNMLQQELISLPARQAAATAKRDLLAARQTLLESKVEALQVRADALRKQEAEKRQAQANQAGERLAERNPLLQRYTQQTQALQSERAEIESKIEADRAALALIKPETARISESLAAADRLREIGAIGDELGELLRRMRADIRPEGALRDGIAERERAVIDARLRRLRLEEDRRTLATPAVGAKQLMERLRARGDAQFTADPALPPLLEGLTKTRLDAISAMLDTLNRRIDQLAEINDASKELLSGAGKLNVLLNDKLLWLPSSPTYGLAWFGQIRSTIEWLGRPSAWWRVAHALQDSAMRHPLRVAVPIILFLVLALAGGRIRRRMAAISDQVGRFNSDSLLLTPEAFLLSFLLALRWALLPGLVGWLLLTSPSARHFVTSIGTGFAAAGLALFVLRSISIMAARGGLLEAHFGWNNRTSRILRGNTLRFTLLAVPSVFLLAAIGASPSQLYRDGLGRLLFLVVAIGLAIYLYRVFDRRKGVVATLAAANSFAWKTRFLWQASAVVLPLIIGIVGFTGYYDGASELFTRFVASLVIVLAGVVFYGVAMRSLLIARQRLEVLRARERREKAYAAKAATQEREATGDAVPAKLEAEEVDLAVVSDQTRALLRTIVVIAVVFGIWLVWRQMASALTILDDVQLWTQVIATKDGSRVVPVTLSNVLVGAAIAAVTLIAARNLPGLLEIAVLQRLAIDSGTRYAITAIARYSIITVGLLLALQRVGADWSQMQWIVAALGVGVGFGLQEIVANFISGLIILFERPVRVGDIVTVGEHSGTISRIQIRATSITDWDNREIIVPNKALLTDKVINWTLSERVTRLVLKVGIAYGSDTELTQRIMMETVKANPRVLTEPGPSVFFVGFGASSLDFELRVFVAETSHRMPVTHELHVAIERALRLNGIEIPFPQQDLHLRLGDLEQALPTVSVKALRTGVRGGE